MTPKNVIACMSKGDVLCMGYEDGKKMFWLEPSREIVGQDVAETIIRLPGISPGGETLVKDLMCQTWRAAQKD